ncbi:MAG: hypothetical protein PHE50_04720 [Dehalococcoidales bacterium]|nr:hypothetical protein [Dehalococcoidales bacterium]
MKKPSVQNDRRIKEPGSTKLARVVYHTRKGKPANVSVNDLDSGQVYWFERGVLLDPHFHQNVNYSTLFSVTSNTEEKK